MDRQMAGRQTGG